jgi:hypothetical protein
MHIFIDFDDVLFNTKAFVADLKDAYLAIPKMTQEVFDACYYGEHDASEAPIKTYSLDAHLKCMAKRIGTETNILHAAANDHIARAERYVFLDCMPFLDQYGKNATILSHGSPEFQKRKIAASGCMKMVEERCIITEEPKSIVLKRIVENGEPFLFIDDRAFQIELVKKAFPYAITVLVQREEGRYKETTDMADHYIGSCDRLFDIL